MKAIFSKVWTGLREQMGERQRPGTSNSWNQLLSLDPKAARKGNCCQEPETGAATGEGQPAGKELLFPRKGMTSLLPPGRSKIKPSLG